MKKLFAIFCAVCLMPSFSAQAWIGGPFSNNSYHGVGGEDGVYEAVASATNTIGFYRIAIGNQFTGIGSLTPANTSILNGTPSINGSAGSGNVVIGALGNQTNSFWYSNGVTYAGRAFGSVQENSTIRGLSTATEMDVTGATGTNTLTSRFTADIANTGSGIAARRFVGSGELTRVGVNAGTETIVVIGSKVSYQILFDQ